MNRRQLVDDRGLQRIAEAVVAILDRQGIRVEHEGALSLLEADGLPVDHGARTVHFPEERIADLVAQRPDRHARTLESAVPRTYSAGMGFEIDPYYFDYPSGAARLGTRQDLVNMVKLGQVTPEVDHVGASVVMSDVDPRLEAVESLVTVALHTDKRIGAVSLHAAENPYFMDIAAILYGEESRMRFVGSGGFMTSPLTMAERVVDLIVAGRDLGVTSASIGTMVIAGMSAPLTSPGCAAIGAAEILGGWLVSKALNPDVRAYSGGSCSGVLDMRTMRVCFGTPEAAMQDAAIALVFEHAFGGGVGIAGMGYTDAQVPGLQCAYEKMLKGTCIAGVLGRPFGIHNPGILDAGRTFSPVQFLLDVELDQSIWRFDRGLEVTDETLGLEAVWEAGISSGAAYIGAEHTLRHFRDGIWYPDLLDRHTDRTFGGGDEASILARAESAWREAVSRYEQPAVDPAKVTALNEVLARARRELL